MTTYTQTITRTQQYTLTYEIRSPYAVTPSQVKVHNGVKHDGKQIKDMVWSTRNFRDDLE